MTTKNAPLRNKLVLWRWEEGLSCIGRTPRWSVGGQMKNVQRGDRLFLMSTRDDELYLLGALDVLRVAPESSRTLREAYGDFTAAGKSVTGPFCLIPLSDLKWQLRFERGDSDRLSRDVRVSSQVQAHRYLTQESAARLLEMLRVKSAQTETAITREQKFAEGERSAIRAVRTVRDPRLRAAAKQYWGTVCYCCGFNFADYYGDAEMDLTVVHHLDPLANAEEEREVTVEQVRVVCPNCHYVLHTEDPPIAADVLRRRLAKRWNKWSGSGIRRR